MNDSNVEEPEESLDSTCSSPEQETVRQKRNSLTCTRGPHVQDLFSRGSEATSISVSEPIANPLEGEILSVATVEKTDSKIELMDSKPKDA